MIDVPEDKDLKKLPEHELSMFIMTDWKLFETFPPSLWDHFSKVFGVVLENLMEFYNVS